LFHTRGHWRAHPEDLDKCPGGSLSFHSNNLANVYACCRAPGLNPSSRGLAGSLQASREGWRLGIARARARHLDGVARGHGPASTAPALSCRGKQRKTLEAGAPSGDAMPPHDTIAGRGQGLERVSAFLELMDGAVVAAYTCEL